MRKSKGLRIGALLAALALVAAACGDDGGEGEGNGEDETYTLGVSNTLVGNSWREQMICSIQAQAGASGVVDEVVVQNENTDTTGQINQIESLISQGVDAIIINPSDVEGLNSVIEEAINQGIVVVSVDQAITAEGVYNVTNDQEEYGYLGAKWLFEHIGEGGFVEMRGADGAPADTARHEGIMRALDEHPEIEVVQETFTGWDPTTGAQQALDIINAGEADGIWTSGIDYTVVEQFQNADAEFLPIVGADNNEFVQQLVEIEELEGAAVSNPPSVGGVGVAIALDALQGEDVEQETLLTPVVTDTSDPEALEDLYKEDIPAGWSSTMVIEPYTTYDEQDVVDCVGPGDES
ncbi:MAG: substrate-binding domain-containing protein [Actinomycetota bacterium]